MPAGRLLLSCGIGLLLLPRQAAAHASQSALVMLLPTDYYLAGGAFAVAASFILLAFVPAERIDALARQRLHLVDLPRLPATVPSAMACLFLFALVFAGIHGSRDPLANPLPLFIWTLWWVGFTLLQAVVGNLWALVNPWSGPLDFLRRTTGHPIGERGLLPLPKRLGYLPAIVVFLAFAWFELIDLAPSDPDRLAVAVSLYWLFAFAGMVVFGERTWTARAEPFSIFFRLIGGMAPLHCMPSGTASPRRVAVFLVWPGRTLIERGAMPLSGILFLLLALATVSFDGFSRTFTWLSLIDVNPLEFPGRSAVMATNTAGLLAAVALLAGGFLAMVAAGCTYVGRGDLFVRAAGHLVYSIAPISIAFHAAHYLTSFLTDSQFAIAAFSDPLEAGWNLLGLEGFRVTTSFTKNMADVTLIWNTQTAIICIGHMVGIIMAHVIALRCFPGVRLAVSSQVGLAALMVSYTVFGLWLLSTPTGI